MLTEDDLFPEPTHAFWNMSNESILYVGGKKPGPCPKRWRGQVVQVIHCKTGVATEGSKNLMLLLRIKEEWNPIELKT